MADPHFVKGVRIQFAHICDHQLVFEKVIDNLRVNHPWLVDFVRPVNRELAAEVPVKHMLDHLM